VTVIAVRQESTALVLAADHCDIYIVRAVVPNNSPQALVLVTIHCNSSGNTCNNCQYRIGAVATSDSVCAVSSSIIEMQW
jgi:hypothetical protein